MKTDPQVMAAVLRKAADNVENDDCAYDGIQALDSDGEWVQVGLRRGIIFEYGLEYRLAPETITIANGVTIPKPLSQLELEKMRPDDRVFSPESSTFKYSHISVYDCISIEYTVIYKTKEDAIEASKALFG
jgi:hypothetical protein